jgi:tetratricopeptide (TPR) repeat protein
MKSRSTADAFDSTPEALLTLLSSHDSPEAFARALFGLDYSKALATDPQLAEMMRACAIPSRFDAGIIGVLRDAPDKRSANSRLLEKLKSFSFVLTRKDGHYVYHDNTRKVVLEDWNKPENREQYEEYKRRLLNFYNTQVSDLYQERKFAETLTPLNLALEIEPKAAWLHFQLGVTHYYMQDFRASLVDFSKAAKLSPRAGIIYHWRGVTHLELQQFKFAVSDFSRAIKHRFEVPINTGWRGLSHLASRHFSKALVDLSRAVRLQPEVATYHYWRGGALRNLGRLKPALAALSRAIELAPKEGESFYWRGVVLFDLGDYEASLADFTKASRLNPKIPYIDYYRALCKLSLGRYAQALRMLDRDCKADPSSPHPVLWRGVARALKGDAAGAAKDWVAAADIARSQENVCEQERALAKLALLGGEAEVAKKHYRQALKRACQIDALQVEQSYLSQLSTLFPDEKVYKRTMGWYKKQLAQVRRQRRA